MTKSLSLLIKPASGSCNMRCKYCFYHDLAEVRQLRSFGMMSEETLELIVKKAFDFADGIVTFGFQGGEPTLRGLDFFKTLVEYVKKYNLNHLKVQFTLQTNGLVIDDEWAQFLSRNRFLVGLSLDGNKDIHDLHRIDTKGEGTYKRIMNTVSLLKKYRVDFNILCVVTNALARHGAKVYKSLTSSGFKYLQFIPCLDSIGEQPGSNIYSLSPERYGRFLIALFNCWYADIQKGKFISIRMFDNILTMLKGYHPESCDMQGSCSKGTVFEADGSMYPCDFYVMSEWRLGNINEHSFEEMLRKPKADRFVSISQNIVDNCRRCDFKAICRGGCRRYKEPVIEGEPLRNYFCESYRMFYSYSLDKFKKAARIL